MGEAEVDPFDIRSPEVIKQRREIEEKGFAFAQQYLVFAGPTADLRARQLFERWITEIENRDIAPNATHAEYAYWEGRRAFVRGIQRQIEFANNGLTQPTPRT